MNDTTAFDKEYRAAKQYTWHLIAIKNYSTQQIRKKLMSREISSETIDAVIRDCQKIGYLDDRQWAESFARNEIRKNNGPNLIIAKLRNKGIPDDIASDVIGKSYPPNLQQAIITKLLKTKYRAADKPAILRALFRRGFNEINI